MKTFKLITPILGLALLSGCKKEPEASFSSDKSFYYTGETIHLKNESVDAKSYRWDFPDGSSSTEKDADYTVNSDFYGAPVRIVLNAYRKNGKKTSTASKTFFFSQPVYPGDHYQVYGKSCKPFTKYCATGNGAYRLTLGEGYRDPAALTYNLTILFLENGRPGPGAYSMSQVRLDVVSEYGAGNAIKRASNLRDGEEMVIVSQTTEGKLQVKFDSIRISDSPIRSYDDHYDYISGNIIF